MQLQLDKTNIAKMLITQLIAFKVARTTAHIIADRTEMDPDGLVLGVATQAGGEIVGMALAPTTDKLVDRTIAKFQEVQKKQQEKAAPQTT